MIQPLCIQFGGEFNLRWGVLLGEWWKVRSWRIGKKGKKDNLIAGWGIYLFIIHYKDFLSRKYKAALTNNHDKTRDS